MSNEIIPLKDEVQMIEKLAKNAVDSKFFDKLGGFGGITSIMIYAKEVGIPPMSALFGGMHNVMGKIEISPQMMNALIRKAGHRIDIVEHTSTKCRLKGTRKGTDESAIIQYTIEDAKRAGIYKPGGGWEKYPEDMLFARCISRLGRRLFPDVIGAMYVDGEISSETESEQVVEETVEVENIPEKEAVVDISVDQVVEAVLPFFVEHPKKEMLKPYIEYLSTLNPNFEQAIKQWKEKPEIIKNCFDKWLDKQPKE